MTDPGGASYSLLDGDAQLYSQFPGNGLDLSHNPGGQSPGLVALNYLQQSSSGEGAYGVERQIAHEFDPDFLTDIGSNGAFQARAGERLRNPAASVGFGSVGLADRESISFNMLNDSGLGDDGCQVDDAADYAGGVDVILNDAAGVD